MSEETAVVQAPKQQRIRLADAWSATLSTVVGAANGLNNTVGLYNKGVLYLDNSLDQAIDEQKLNHIIDIADRKARAAEQGITL